MGKLNNTKNQHFISQVEQKLNSINPDDVRKKRRIYKFNVIDRENSKVVLVSANGSRIENSLSINDLFTYAINENGLRHNLEQEFENYEAKLESLTKEFLIKAGADRKEITHEIIGLFTCKFLNLIRNPYCIKKTLNIFSQYIDYKPTEPQLLAEYALISNIKEVDISSLLIRLGVTLTEYKNWLQVLFLVLMRNPGSEVNLLEEIIRSILSNNDTYKMFRIDHYLNSVAEEKVILSDRSWILVSPDESPHLIMQFNLSSSLLMTFTMSDVQANFEEITKNSGRHIPQKIVEHFKNTLKSIDCQYVKNDLPFLINYNKLALYQCKDNVYADSTTIIGVEVLQLV